MSGETTEPSNMLQSQPRDTQQPRDRHKTGDSVLNLPACELNVRSSEDGRLIYDSFRRKYVRLTPEEWVRQHFLRYLVDGCGYPASLIAVEVGFQYQGMPRRADLIVHGRDGKPYLMAECKSPDVRIVQSTFDQVSHYNRVVGARFLAVTNGMSHFCWRIEAGKYHFLDGIPPFET